MARKYTGRAFIYIDGALYESGDDAKLTGVMGVKRNTVKGAQVYGFTEEVVEATVQASFFHNASISLSAFEALTDITVTFQTDSGPVFTLVNAWTSEMGELGAKEGKFSVTFTSADVDES